MKTSLAGQVFGSLTVVAEADRAQSGHRRWACRCTCGAETVVYATHLRSGKSTSCQPGGCSGGLGKKTPGYRTWESMIARCSKATHPAYHRYGGRGIVVCERWLAGFRLFYEDMGPRPDGLSLERINGDGNYEPGNCKWATVKEQQNNTSTNRLIDVAGVRLTIAQFADSEGVKYSTMYSRLRRDGVI